MWVMKKLRVYLAGRHCTTIGESGPMSKISGHKEVMKENVEYYSDVASLFPYYLNNPQSAEFHFELA
jgi:hypothetical protein